MPRRPPWDPADVEALASLSRGVVRRRDLLAVGVPPSSISHLVRRPDGQWSTLLPGTYLTRRGEPAPEQRLVAAVLHAGPAAVLTGACALEWRGLAPLGRSATVHVLVPHGSRRSSTGFLLVERTRRPPAADVVRGLATAPVPRAVVDATRRMRKLPEVVALVARVLQRGDCSEAALHAELRAAGSHGTALVRRALEETDAGARSVVEVLARRCLHEWGLPDGERNVDLVRADGTFIARPDTYWRGAGVAWEIESREWHTSPEDWQRTLDRRSALGAAGVLVVQTTPQKLRGRPAAVRQELEGALQAGRRRGPAPGVEVHGLRRSPRGPGAP